MNETKAILNIAKQNNGMITTAMVTKAGISRGNLKYLVDTGKLEKASRGVYTLPNVLEDEFLNLQSRFKRGIFSLDTALFLYNLTDRTPLKFHMTFPESYNLTNPKKEGVLCNVCKEPYYNLGITEVITPAGNTVRAYSPERTLCDILNNRKHVDIQIVAEAFKQYMVTDERDIPLLSEYATKLKVDKRLRAYLEVLL